MKWLFNTRSARFQTIWHNSVQGLLRLCQVKRHRLSFCNLHDMWVLNLWAGSDCLWLLIELRLVDLFQISFWAQVFEIIKVVICVRVVTLSRMHGLFRLNLVLRLNSPLIVDAHLSEIVPDARYGWLILSSGVFAGCMFWFLGDNGDDVCKVLALP